jgi:nicotinate phosphoribosyltransferase
VIYKLVELERGEVRNAAKFSEAKVTYPGRKQVFRFSDTRGEYTEDIIALEDEQFPRAEPLLVPVMRGGKRLLPTTDLGEARKRCLAGVERLPDGIAHGRPASSPAGRPDSAVGYPVRYSARLKALLGEVRRRVERTARI